jgi:hypothetical protein
MKRPVIIAVLWFYAAWTAGAFLDFTVVDSPLGAAIGPVLGILAGGLAFMNSRRSGQGERA